VLLEQGRLEELGEPADVIHRYHALGSASRESGGTGERAPVSAAAHARPGSGELRLRGVELLDAHGRPTGELETGEAATVRLHYEAKEPVREPNFGVRIFDPQNTLVLSLAATRVRRGVLLEGAGFVDCRVAGLPLMPGSYGVQVKVSGEVLLDLVENAAAFSVRASPRVIVDSAQLGIAWAEPEWSFH
jgi:hypothetical protein